jgi:hypothetical protein
VLGARDVQLDHSVGGGLAETGRLGGDGACFVGPTELHDIGDGGCRGEEGEEEEGGGELHCAGEWCLGLECLEMKGEMVMVISLVGVKRTCLYSLFQGPELVPGFGAEVDGYTDIDRSRL